MIRLLFALLVTGCAAVGANVAPYDKDAVMALLKPCPIAALKANTVSEDARVATERAKSLATCNADKAKLRELLQ